MEKRSLQTPAQVPTGSSAGARAARASRSRWGDDALAGQRGACRARTPRQGRVRDGAAARLRHPVNSCTLSCKARRSMRSWRQLATVSATRRRTKNKTTRFDNDLREREGSRCRQSPRGAGDRSFLSSTQALALVRKGVFWGVSPVWTLRAWRQGVTRRRDSANRAHWRHPRK